MLNISRFLLFFLLFQIGLFVPPAHSQCTDTTGVIYVDQDAVGANTGLCWTDAFNDLQDALYQASAGDHIWVAEGLYNPAPVLTSWLLTFNLVDSVATYGGFNGTEDSLHQRDWVLNETILTGDIGGYHVYTVINAHETGSETILDGFIIENGAAKIENIPSGIYNDTSSARYSNCIIRSNHTSTSSGYPIYDYGVGAIMNVGGAPLFYNCKIIGNSSNTNKANHSAGAVLNLFSDAQFYQCEFNNNGATAVISGAFVSGGILNIGGEQIFTNCLFSGNTCGIGAFYTYSAGAFINHSNSIQVDSCQFTFNITNTSNNFSQTAGGILNYQSSPSFNRCNISENGGSASNGRPFMSGGIINTISNPTFMDCIIQSNHASTEFAAGGIMNFSSDPIFIRCKINQNTVQHSIAESYSTGIGGVLNSGGNPIFSHCDISGNSASSSCLFSSEVVGGILNDTANVTLINCNISNNSALSTTNSNILIAGASLSRNDSITLQNCTIANNSSLGYGTTVNNSGGILAMSCHHQVTNSIVYGNVISNNGNRSVDVLISGGSFYADHCLFEEYAGGSHNLVNINPYFIDADTVGSDALGDYRLRAESVGLNAGSSDHLSTDPFDLDSDGNILENMPVDLASNKRIISCDLDLGAYENETDILCPDLKVLTGDSLIECSATFLVTLLESDSNTWYYLIDENSGKILDGYKSGNGSALVFSTGFISESKCRALGVDKKNTAYRFGGTNDFVHVPTSSQLNLDSVFTISCWIKLTDSFPSSGTILNRGENYHLSFNAGDTSIHFLSNYYTGDDPNLNTSLTLFPDTNWHYIAYSYDGDTMYGYVDDVLRFSEAKNFVLDSIDADLFMGAADSFSGSGLMVVDDIRIWNTCNSALQLKNEKSTCAQPLSPGLMAFYRFNEDSMVLDHSGNGLHGLPSSISMPKEISSGSCISNAVQFTYAPDSSGQTIYVNANVDNGWNSGYCWGDAFTDLQSALAVADSGDQIWVAEGVYRPTADLDRSISFVIPDGVSIFGGFEGHETSLSQRNWMTHPTILDGELSTEWHTYTVVKSINSGPETALDGFTIQAGKCDQNRCAGGIYTDSSQAQFSNCIIIDNEANDQSGQSECLAGGGVYNKNGSPIFINCIMANNSAFTLAYPFSAAGGAVLNENTHAQFINCTMSGNYAAPFSYVSEYGAGAVLCYNDSSSFYNCIFWNNVALALTEVSDLFPLGSSIRVESCLLEEYATGVNCIVGQDPLFTSSHYQLDSLSPAINQGIASALPPDIFDLDDDNDVFEPSPFAIDGMPRIQACVPDMGVHELPQTHRVISGTPTSGIYSAEHAIISDAMINSPQVVEFHAGNYVELIDSFSVELGAVFDIYIGPCDSN